uniref:Protease HtpX homolog n=1 Tax=Candidatus Giovannonibacteria bacterium GW2011_GWF2_42_19 TaxID=1618659 RepID=A0A0G1C970_9BACT|nr:MAG: Protease HtpX-like protein [Candidatus Giovannonibacteria bacterium GW2011_GWF2_42_19]
MITIFLVFITTLGWFFSKVYGNPAIFAIAFILSVVMSLGSYWFSDKIVIATTGARPLSEKEAPEVYNIVENLAITAGLPKPRIFIVDSVQPNAFATGRNAEHAIVAVTTGILQIMSRSELEGVIAHEMSHIGNRDMLVSTVVVVLVGVVQLLSDIFLRQMRWGIGGNDRDRGQAQMVFVLIGIALAILSPIAAMLIQLAVSRKREYLADASGALLTRYPDGLASALQKLANDHTPMRQANHATAHLWLDDPYQGKKKTIGWFAKLFMTHPPIEDRIRRLREMGV